MSLWPPVWRGCCRSWQRDSKYIKPISFHWWEKSIWPSVLFTCRLSRRDGGADEVDLLLTWSHWRPAGHSGRLRATRRLTRCKNMTWFKFESYWQQVWWDATTLDLLICTEYTVFFFFSSSSSPSSFLIPHITINRNECGLHLDNTVSRFFFAFLTPTWGQCWFLFLNLTKQFHESTAAFRPQLFHLFSVLRFHQILILLWSDLSLTSSLRRRAHTLAIIKMNTGRCN